MLPVDAIVKYSIALSILLLLCTLPPKVIPLTLLEAEQFASDDVAATSPKSVAFPDVA